MVHIKLDSFDKSIFKEFAKFRQRELLVDFSFVTCDGDGKKLKAHKIIIFACSPFLRDLLQTDTSHSVFYMNDVKFEILKAIVDYMYAGEVDISNEHLDDFFKIGEKLQILGLDKKKYLEYKNEIQVSSKRPNEDDSEIQNKKVRIDEGINEITEMEHLEPKIEPNEYLENYTDSQMEDYNNQQQLFVGDYYDHTQSMNTTDPANIPQMLTDMKHLLNLTRTEQRNRDENLYNFLRRLAPISISNEDLPEKFILKKMETNEEILIFEEQLKVDVDFKTNVFLKLATLGGKNDGHILRNIFYYLFDDVILQHYSWNGTAEKHRFSCLLEIQGIICQTARKNNSNFTDVTYSTFCKDFLKHAKHRYVTRLGRPPKTKETET